MPSREQEFQQLDSILGGRLSMPRRIEYQERKQLLAEQRENRMSEAQERTIGIQEKAAGLQERKLELELKQTENAMDLRERVLGEASAALDELKDLRTDSPDYEYRRDSIKAKRYRGFVDKEIGPLLNKQLEANDELRKVHLTTAAELQQRNEAREIAKQAGMVPTKTTVGGVTYETPPGASKTLPSGITERYARLKGELAGHTQAVESERAANIKAGAADVPYSKSTELTAAETELGIIEKQHPELTGASTVPTTTPAAVAPAPPAVGEMRGGYRFKGGNPADKASWEK